MRSKMTLEELRKLRNGIAATIRETYQTSAWKEVEETGGAVPKLRSAVVDLWTAKAKVDELIDLEMQIGEIEGEEI